MDALDLVALPQLMALTQGRRDLVVGLVDGPVEQDHPELAGENVRSLATFPAACTDSGSTSCRHGTFVAGVLAGRRESGAPAIAPGCTLLVRPVFSEVRPVGQLPSATPRELAAAIVDCIDGGARVLNISAALTGASFGAERDLQDALQWGVQRGVLIVVAAGNQGVVGGSAITRHPWIIPVVAYSRVGRPLAQSNLGRSIGLRGLGGPGERVLSLAPYGDAAIMAGTSVAAPFIAGTAALLWSLFPAAAAADIKRAMLSAAAPRRRTVTPPLLNAWGAYQVLSAGRQTRNVS